MISDGRLDSNRVNSRTATIWADIEMKHEKRRQEGLATTGWDIGKLNYAGLSADIKSDTASNTNITKQIDMMETFEQNIKFQRKTLETFLDKKQKEYNGWFRTGSRITNIPFRAFRQKIAGSADEATVDTILKEISAEIAKLSTGSTGSVAEVSASAREMWDKIHDPALSVGDIKQLIAQIDVLGEGRLNTAKQVRDSVRERTGTTTRGIQPKGKAGNADPLKLGL
jgi:hypothetical protein